MPEWTAHSKKQSQLIFGKKRLTIGATGVQWGKTESGVVWLKTQIHKYTHPDDNFIITSPTFPILEQSTLPPFLKYMDGLGRLDRKDMVYHLHNGGRVYIRTGKNPDSVVGIPRTRAILCDEAGLYTLYFWENIQARSSPKQCPIRIVTSPYNLGWLYKDYIRPIMRDPSCLPNVELIQATSKENQYFPAEEYDEKERTMDPRRFQMMYGGKFSRMEGLVYNCFHEIENQISQEAMQLPFGTKFKAGVDWGHTHPFVIKVRAITPGGTHFAVSEFVKTGLTVFEMIDAAKQKMAAWGIDRFYCGPDRPENIMAFNSAGIPSSPANNEVKHGIDLHYELIKTRRYKMVEGANPHTLTDYETYHWPDPKDLKQDQDDKEPNPVKQNDDTMDAERYVTVMTYKSGSGKLPAKNPSENKKSGEDQLSRIKRLKKRAGNADRSERWD